MTEGPGSASASQFCQDRPTIQQRPRSSHDPNLRTRPRGAHIRGGARLEHGRRGDRPALVWDAGAGRSRRAARRQRPVTSRRQLPPYPVLRDRLHARLDRRAERWADVGRDGRRVRARTRDVPGHDQRPRHERAAPGLPEVAGDPPPRIDRPGSRAGAPGRCRRGGEGADLHPGRHSRQRVRGRGRRDAADREARDDARGRRPRGRRDPRPRRGGVQPDPEPRWAGGGHAGERQWLRPQPRLPDPVTVRDARLDGDHARLAPARGARPARLRDADADRGDDEAAQPEHRVRPLAEVEPGPDRRERGGAERRRPSRCSGRSTTGARTPTCRLRPASARTATCRGRPRPRAGTTGAPSTPRCTPSTSGSTPRRSRCARA